MPFLRENIDRAIVMTQYDLRGFAHPLGLRLEKGASAKSLDAITCNFIPFAVGLGKENNAGPTDDSYISTFEATFEQCLVMCQRLAADCDFSEKEAIQLIIQEIVTQSKEMKAQVATGQRKSSPYLKPLEKGNRWGNIVLALAEAFEVALDQAVS